MSLITETMRQFPDVPEKKYTAKDFQTDQDVRWCPGCGDYSVLAQVQRVLPELNIPREKLVWISGIGCSSRFPYYVQTYGLHGIHGRATAIASGLKIARPDLSVWVATGDGDGMSIGGNHLIHLFRRNIGLKVLLFNNQIYGLTKGQFSPTSVVGQVTSSTPFGSIDHPFNPMSLALGSGAGFVARAIDRDPKGLQEIIRRAAAYNGTAFVEIYQNCNVFNDGAFAPLTEKETREDNVLVLEHGKPLVFGKDRKKGVRLNRFTPEIVDLADGRYTEADLIVHNEQDRMLAMILGGMSSIAELPRPVGVIYAVERPRYEEEMKRQIDEVIARRGAGDLEALLRGGETWAIE